MSSTKQPEMGVSLTTSFHKPSHAPPTPPLSPQTHGKELKRQTSRFRLPKILRRAHTSDSVSTAAPAAIQPSSSTVSTFSKCSTQDDPSDRAYPGVYGTKQPIPGPMPVVQMSVAKDDSLTRTMSKKLRKMPKSYQNLRAFKSDIQPNSELTKTSIRVPALLPSPLPSDEEGRSREGFCAFQNPRGAVATKANDVQPSYEDEGIVAGYCEDVFEDNIRSFGITSAVPRGRKQNSAVPSEPQESPHDSGDIRTPPKSNMSATLRSPKRDRSSSLSSEATWLSPSFARQDTSICMSQLERIQMNEKRLAEKARRCCHLVEGPEVDLPASWSGERKASYATLIKPGKANDIWVPRPNSTNPQSTRRRNSVQNADMPRTPERKLSEVSAFSPWDSPAERLASPRTNRHGDSPLGKVVTSSSLRHSYTDYTPTKKPRVPARKSSLGPVLSPPPLSIRTSSSASTLGSDFSQANSLTQSPGKTYHDNHAAWSRCGNLARILDDLSQSIDDYPASLLQLDSPVILQTRSSNSLDEFHLDRLRKIFPSASTIHLSSLAALLLAQSYLANLSPVPEPAPIPISEYLRLAMTSNESLNHIPTKTLTTLGIHLANVTSMEERGRERALRKRAKIVEAALHVALQKMMVIVCGAYDEVLCRTLRCLVETVEQGW